MKFCLVKQKGSPLGCAPHSSTESSYHFPPVLVVVVTHTQTITCNGAASICPEVATALRVLYFTYLRNPIARKFFSAIAFSLLSSHRSKLLASALPLATLLTVLFPGVATVFLTAPRTSIHGLIFAAAPAAKVPLSTGRTPPGLVSRLPALITMPRRWI